VSAPVAWVSVKLLCDPADGNPVGVGWTWEQARAMVLDIYLNPAPGADPCEDPMTTGLAEIALLVPAELSAPDLATVLVVLRTWLSDPARELARAERLVP
jgi:hypothetical protein